MFGILSRVNFHQPAPMYKTEKTVQKNARDMLGEKRQGPPTVSKMQSPMRAQRVPGSTAGVGAEGPGQVGHGPGGGKGRATVTYFLLFASFNNEHVFLL